MDIYSECNPDTMHRLGPTGDLRDIGGIFYGAVLYGFDHIGRVYVRYGFDNLITVLSFGM